MCGITGLLNFTPAPVEKSLLKRMNDSLTHRGPDSDGFYYHGRAGMAMRRLKVIDLETGNQPISNADKTLWIVFNGEIYNYRELRAALEKKGHRFYTHSDTEVILHQYQEEGEDCVHSLIGMFAFAVYDTERQSFFIARDRLGIKPLFYAQRPEGFAFASELKALLEIPWIEREINLQALSHYLSLNYLPSPWTPIEGVVQLPPGHTMRVENGKVSIRQYWDVPLGETIDTSEEEASKTILELLHQSMQRRLIADVPIGTFLSGGLDSSTLVYLMKEHRHERIKTFSVGFDHPKYDETPYAREVSRYFGTEHHEIHCTSADVEKSAPRIAWHADNLLADQAALPLYLVSALAKQHVTVCLSGDGGDEAFVGYPTFHADRYHAIYRRLPGFIRRSLEAAVPLLPGSDAKLSFEYKAKKFVEAGGFSAEKAHYWWRTIYRDDEKSELLLPEISRRLKETDSFPLYEEFISKKSQRADIVERALYADLKVWLAGNNLYKVDTMTMAHGLEARVPFLDHELIEYLSRLPSGLRFRGGKLKFLLKKILPGKLPDTILRRKKAGFHSPIAAWMSGPLKSHLQSQLLSEDSPVLGFIRREGAAKLLDEHFTGRHNHAFKIWGLLILSHWLKAYGASAGSPAKARVADSLIP